MSGIFWAQHHTAADVLCFNGAGTTSFVAIVRCTTPNILVLGLILAVCAAVVQDIRTITRWLNNSCDHKSYSHENINERKNDENILLCNNYYRMCSSALSINWATCRNKFGANNFCIVLLWKLGFNMYGWNKLVVAVCFITKEWIQFHAYHNHRFRSFRNVSHKHAWDFSSEPLIGHPCAAFQLCQSIAVYFHRAMYTTKSSGSWTYFGHTWSRCVEYSDNRASTSQQSPRS